MNIFLICYISIFICCSCYSMSQRTRRPFTSLQYPETLHTAYQAKKFIVRYNAYKQFEHNLSQEIVKAEETDISFHEQQVHNYTLLRLKKLKKYVEITETKQLFNFFNPTPKSSSLLVGTLFQNLLTEQNNSGELSTLKNALNTIDNTTLKALESLQKEILNDTITLESKKLIKQKLQLIFNSYLPIELTTEQLSAVPCKLEDSL